MIEAVLGISLGVVVGVLCIDPLRESMFSWVHTRPKVSTELAAAFPAYVSYTYRGGRWKASVQVVRAAVKTTDPAFALAVGGNEFMGGGDFTARTRRGVERKVARKVREVRLREYSETGEM